MDKVKIYAPATIANLGPGFDVFAMALREPYDIMEVQKIESDVVIENEGYPIPEEPEKNCAGFVALEILKDFEINEGVRIKIKKQIKPASGLGSSAASCAGASFTLNKLFNLNLTKKELVDYASRGEVISAGFPHCDNVVACIFGGFTITVSYKPLEVANFKPPNDLRIVVALPNIDKGSTELSRGVVPEFVPIKKLVYNVGHASLLSAGIASKSIDLIKKAMDDCIIEPARAKAGFLKEFSKFKEEGKRLGAGIAASGAGPAIVGIIEKEKDAELADVMRNIFVKSGYDCKIYITEPGRDIEIVSK